MRVDDIGGYVSDLEFASNLIAQLTLISRQI